MAARKKKRRTAGRPKGGSDAIVRAVLDTTRDLLAAGGLAAVRIDDVARAAGVHKTSVYRRWPTTADLVLAAFAAPLDPQPPFASTGSLEKDLVALLRKKAAGLSTPRGRRIARALMAVGDVETSRVAAGLRQRRYSLPTAAIDAAIARGAEGTDAVLVAELLHGPVMHRLLVLDKTVDDAFLRKVVAGALAVARAR